ncbi:MAG: phosphoribosyl-ATP diphosphatase [Alphaproteobacteria bacterium GM202ARS2]|nr:phosphoribosyl-ATP diphosphatase [Alphaproteobacteria bacterium GM202ARS2]
MATMTPSPHIIDTLMARIKERQRAGNPQSSWTARLLAQGSDACCRKLNEEVLELILAVKNKTPDAVIDESADVLYHLLVLWAHSHTDADAVWRALQERMAQSGIEEKESRS